MKDDLIDRAARFVKQQESDGDARPEAAALVAELVDALEEHRRDAIRALWSVVKAQGGYARVPKLFVQAMGPDDRLDAQVEPSGEAVIYKALSAAR